MAIGIGKTGSWTGQRETR